MLMSTSVAENCEITNGCQSNTIQCPKLEDILEKLNQGIPL